MRPDNALRMNYDYECITITALRKPSPRLTRAPGFASRATERTGAAFRPDGAMIQDQGPDPRGVLQQSGGVGRLCLSGRLRTAQEASKRGMGAEPPCKPRPCSQEAACSRLMAVTQRRRPPRLADLPHDQRQRPGGEAPSSTAPHDDRRPDRRGPRKYRPHASHAPGTSTPTGARQGPPARAGPPRRAPVGVAGGRARQRESPSTDAGFVQSRIPLSLCRVTCCIRDKPRPLRGLFAR